MSNHDLHVFTLALNSMPWLERVADSLLLAGQLRPNIRWTIIHGYAEPVADTSWCKPIDPPKDDGTLKLLDGLETFAGVRVIRRERWPGKTAMCNAALETFDDEQGGVLMQMDSDEVWTPAQLRVLPSLFDRWPDADAAMFLCRYWITPNRYICTPGAWGNNPAYEWIRAWRWIPGARFLAHEPPRLAGADKFLTHAATAQLGLVFDHYAYATREQVAHKQEYYGYAGAVAQWDALCAESGPVDVSQYLPWVRGNVMSYEA
jgi:hypothetical protein